MFQKKMFLFSMVILVALSFVLVACGQQQAAPPASQEASAGAQTGETKQSEPKAEGPQWGGVQFLRAGGGSSGSGVYQLMAMVSEPWNKIPGIQSTTVAGDATSNIKSVENGELEFAYTSPDLSYLAVRGEGQFAGKPITNVAFFQTQFPLPVVVAVRADSPIKSIEELKGKRISSGVTGQIADTLGKGLLEAYGITPDNIKQTGGSWNSLSSSQLVEMTQSKTLDAFMLASGEAGQNPSFKPLVDSIGVRFLPIDEDKIDAALQKYPYFAKVAIKGGVYPNQPDDYITMAGGSISIVSAKLPADLVYEMLKQSYQKEVMDKIHAQTDMYKTFTLQNGLKFLKASGIPLHPGAVKFYEENGVKSP